MAMQTQYQRNQAAGHQTGSAASCNGGVMAQPGSPASGGGISENGVISNKPA
jgi:hypothetical protein